MALPDFLIIGAMKCGTSTLQAQLTLQEGVFMTTPKEPNFFSDDDVYSRGIDWYEDLFADAGQGELKGEASTHYTKLPTYPHTLDRMLPVLPDVRLIYVIRDPLDRAISHYIHEWTEARMGDDAIAAFREHPELVQYGCYGMQIAPFVEAYGVDGLFLTSLEQLKSDPDREFSRIADFLGLSAGASWRNYLGPQNVSAERMRRLPMQGLLLDNSVAQFLRRSLVPKQVRTWVRESRTMRKRPSLPETLQDQLRVEFLRDREVLAGMFPAHPVLEICYPFASK